MLQLVSPSLFALNDTCWGKENCCHLTNQQTRQESWRKKCVRVILSACSFPVAHGRSRFFKVCLKVMSSPYFALSRVCLRVFFFFFFFFILITVYEPHIRKMHGHQAHSTGNGKRGKISSGCQARENMQAVPSAGKLAFYLHPA